ncbi:proline-rich transmembrane protein 1 [Strongylocentrotus purpuratus]|uniref:Uncharacterized protein n=1 Tax=Strongylocentrotus purpuratus TaxID=7668 RepID=A0A7M7GGJ8_STRPU|nr:proline-rich transmembrane protein 1 [Strongylocentrotus purpuratus]|eukprot:XP_003727604.1 PREDICTED: proline-rich transmembrane protein 1 [Strongylocentrotus purpuratus]
MTSEYKQFTNEDCDVEGGGYDNLPSYDESNAIPSSAPPQNPYPPPNSSEYPMQQPSHSQQAAQFPQQHPGTDVPQSQPGTYAPQQHPGTDVPQPQEFQAPIQQNIVHVSTGIAPNDYFGLALCVTLCCCLPFGIVALIKSNQVRNRSAEGDYHGAAIASLEAKRWSSIGLLLGSISIGVSVIGGIMSVTLGALGASY